jgi:hypothetical protein
MHARTKRKKPEAASPRVPRARVDEERVAEFLDLEAHIKNLNIRKTRSKLASRHENSPYSSVPSISQNPHRLSAAILLYFQSLQNGVLRAFL